MDFCSTALIESIELLPASEELTVLAAKLSNPSIKIEILILLGIHRLALISRTPG
jgi:hypothetical protein